MTPGVVIFCCVATAVLAVLVVMWCSLHKVQHAKNTRHFISLPIGARFIFDDADGIWVVLDLEGCGRVAEWKGLDYPASQQRMRLVTKDERYLKEVVVTVVH